MSVDLTLGLCVCSVVDIGDVTDVDVGIELVVIVEGVVVTTSGVSIDFTADVGFRASTDARGDVDVEVEL